MATPELAILGENLLRNLARVIRYQESEAIYNIIFRSEIERSQYLRDSASNYGSVLTLLDDALEIRDKFRSDGVRRPIAGAVFDYVVYCCNDALQTVPNYTLRKSYLEKITDHVGALVQAVTDLDPADADRVESLTLEAEQSRDVALEYLRKYSSAASRNFSKWLKDTNTKFEDLVRRYQVQLGYTGPFDNLEESKKIRVYEEIIEVSGRGKISTADKVSDIFGKLGTAVRIFKAGKMAWDIYTAENKLETATKEAVVAAASAGGAALGQIIGSALGTQLVGVQASTLFITAAGILGGIVGAFILGAAAGLLMDLIFGSGGSAPLSTDGHTCYVSPMPDGPTLARQIAHQNKLMD